MILVVAQLIAAAVVVNRLRRGAPVRPASSGRPVSGSVSVIIPARNESQRIGRCLAALRVEKLYEVIVVDDCSSDDTKDVAARLGAQVVSGAPLPRGWVGKPWALQQGLIAASGDIVVFLDADTIPRTGLITALTSALAEADLVSLGARFRCDSVIETALHASLLTTLVYRFGPPGTPLSHNRTIINGQCFATCRQWLIEEGGFTLAAANMTDDVAFARNLAARGALITFADGSALIDVDMHDSAGELWREWGRSLSMHDVTPPSRRYGDLATVWLTLGVPWVRLLGKRATIVDAALIVMRIAMNGALSRSYAAARFGLLASPLTDIPALARLTQATLRPARSWRGREYGPGRAVGRAESVNR